jgi:hypothetical protein
MSELVDLLAATEAVGDDDRGWPRGSNRREQALIRDGLRDLEFAGLKTKGPGHAAAAGLDEFDRGAGLAEKCYFIARAAEDRFVMAVAVD